MNSEWGLRNAELRTSIHSFEFALLFRIPHSAFRNLKVGGF